MQSISAVPVIDIAPFTGSDPAARQAVVDHVRGACEDIGFLTIVGHGVSAQLIGQMRDAFAISFALPDHRKLAISRPAQHISRGYNPIGNQALGYTLGATTPPDLQESFGFGHCDVAADDPYCQSEMGQIFFAPNLWPDQPTDLKKLIITYRRVMDDLANRIMHIFAAALGLEESFFDAKIDRPISVLRIVNYPGQATPPLAGQWR
ncbi:MAG: isopenicillin N synthase family oxygenase, partial [Proteobacteria bacterium]|nr:isopenicillin N synthase family oxygenase [Pseudomonadota bacterium]